MLCQKVVEPLYKNFYSDCWDDFNSCLQGKNLYIWGAVFGAMKLPVGQEGLPHDGISRDLSTVMWKK
jgi:hypothetical protein